MTQEPFRSKFAEAGARSKMDYEMRLVRFSLMLAMKNALPPYSRKLSLQLIADELARLGYERISRERVRQLLREGRPRRRPDDGLARRRAKLERRIELWRSHETPRGDARANEYAQKLGEVVNVSQGG